MSRHPRIVLLVCQIPSVLNKLRLLTLLHSDAAAQECCFSTTQSCDSTGFLYGGDKQHMDKTADTERRFEAVGGVGQVRSQHHASFIERRLVIITTTNRSQGRKHDCS